MRAIVMFAVAGGLLVSGASVGTTKADSRNEQLRSRYDSEDVIRKIRDREAAQASADGPADSSDRDDGPRGSAPPPPPPERERERHSRGGGPRDCADCAPRKKYDSQEVIKNTRDVDRSRVINTVEEVEVKPRTREHNHLVVHENETRDVGVVQHNHTILEKEIRYVRRKPHYPPPVHVVTRYRNVVVPQPIIVPVVQRHGCGGGLLTPSYGVGCGGGYQHATGYAPAIGYAQTPAYISGHYPAYGYGGGCGGCGPYRLY